MVTGAAEEKSLEDIDLSRLGMAIIDMQDFFLKHLNDFHRERIIYLASEMIKISKKHSYPIFAVKMVDVNINGYHVDYGELNEDIAKNLEGSQARYYEKEKNSAFSDENFKYDISQMQLQYMCYVGVHSSLCVRDTAIDGVKIGIKPITAKGLIATHNSLKTTHFEAVKWFRENGLYSDSYSSLIDILKRK
jgi:isochorismate hydrolase